MREYDLITSILGNFSRSEKQKNDAFACDAEIVSIGGADWGITMDEFSPEEDMFGEMEAFAIGRNLATAVLSDLFAGGAGLFMRLFIGADRRNCLSLKVPGKLRYLAGILRVLTR